MKKLTQLTAVLVAAVAISGCGALPPGKHIDVADTIFNVGFTDIGADNRDRNMIAVVGFDEAFIGDYTKFARNVMWREGFVEGTPEYLYRAVLLNMPFASSVLWERAGERAWPTAAVIPDHIGLLQAWDLVEFRSTGSRHTTDNFSKTGEGNIVLRVLCRRADPNYERCRDALPRAGKVAGGSTGTPYPASAKAYGYTFTPAYDVKGNGLRTIPNGRP